jgi:hypothetical protein
MDSLSNRLPGRFPVGTRYVIEGRREGDGDLRISLRCLEFPDGRQVQLPADQARLPAAKAERRRSRPGRQVRAARSRKSARK